MHPRTETNPSRLKKIIREDHQSIAVLRMEHGKANAIDIPLLEALDVELTRVEQSDTRALVLRELR